jgi:hypothetical protein
LKLVTVDYYISQIQSISDVADKIEANGDVASATYLRTYLDEDIMQCMVDVLKVHILRSVLDSRCHRVTWDYQYRL